MGEFLGRMSCDQLWHDDAANDGNGLNATATLRIFSHVQSEEAWWFTDYV